MIRFVIALWVALFTLQAQAAVEIQEVTSPGGIRAWLVEERSIPFMALEIRFRGGSVLDEPGKRGSVNLMTALLEEGSANRDAREFAKTLEGLAATFEFEAFDNSVSVSARFLTENRNDAVALLRDALVEPRFDQESIERVRAQVVSIIQSDEKDPNTIASRTFDELAFGDHPYASSRDGTVESVSSLTRDDLVAAHQNTLARDRIFVGAVGDISADDLGVLLDDLFGDLPETGAPMAAEADYQLDGGVTVVDYETPQAVLFFGHEGIKRDDPDFFPAFIANEIMGGSGFQSRLQQEVRVKRGLTYGIGTSLVPMDLGALVLGQVATANETAGETLDVVLDQWRQIAEEGVTEQELDRAKTFLTGAYPLRFDGNARIAGIMVGMQMQGLPIDYIATRNDKVRAVTLDDIKRVAQRIYRPDDLHVVVVGQPEGLSETN